MAVGPPLSRDRNAGLLYSIPPVAAAAAAAACWNQRNLRPPLHVMLQEAEAEAQSKATRPSTSLVIHNGIDNYYRHIQFSIETCVPGSRRQLAHSGVDPNLSSVL